MKSLKSLNEVFTISVTAVIVTYNRLNLLKQCLQHLLDQSYKVNKIVIINNNSSDGTKEYLNNLNNNRILFKNLNKNLGGAGGFSLGTKIAYEKTQSNYFWIMDDDSLPTKNALSKLINKAQLLRGHFGFLCSNVRWWKDHAPCNIPKVSNDWTKLTKFHLIKVRSATFVSILVPRQRVKKLGLPVGQMFIWGDDTEYTTRLSLRYNSYFVYDSIILHNSSVNNETLFNAATNRIKFYGFMIRNLIYIDKKYYSSKRLIKDILSFMFDGLRIPFKSSNHILVRMYMVYKGIIKGIFFNPKIIFPKVNYKE